MTYDDGKILDIVAFDISLWLNGIEIQPENGNVNVSIEPLLKNNEGEDSVAEVFHITEDGDVELRVLNALKALRTDDALLEEMEQGSYKSAPVDAAKIICEEIISDVKARRR